MNGVEKKVLRIGLGGIAATLLMAGGQTNAAVAPCPADESLTSLLALGTCQIADKIFSDFSFTTDLATHALFTINPGTGDVVLTFSRDGAPGTGYLTGANKFSYMVSVAPGSSKVIVEDTLGVDVSTGTPPVNTIVHINGNNSGMNMMHAMNGATVVLPLSMGDMSQMVSITATQPSKAQLNTISNDFAEIMETSVPEPASLSLFGLGLLGLGFARRRRS